MHNFLWPTKNKTKNKKSRIYCTTEATVTHRLLSTKKKIPKRKT